MKHPVEIYIKLLRSLSQPSAGIFACCWTSVLAVQQDINGFHGIILCAAVCGSLSIAAAGLAFSLRSGRGFPDRAARVTAFLILCLSAVLVTFYRASPPLADHPVLRGDIPPAEISYRVVSDDRRRYSREIGLVILQEEKLKGAAYIPLNSPLKVNDTIISDFRPDILSAGDPGLSPFDRQRLRRGIPFSLRLYDGTFKTVPGEESPRLLLNRGLERALDSIYTADTSAFLKGLYFGNNSYIHKERVYTFKRAGVMHVLAASGLHVGIVVLIPFAFARLFRINSPAVFVAAIALLIFYLFIADAPVSLTRAFIMFCVLAIQRIFFLNSDSLNALFTAGTIILLLRPAEAFMPGFLLSFGATFGILAFYDLYHSSFERLPRFAASSFALTMSAQLAAAPLILVFMKEINLTGIISNLVVIPAVALMLSASLLINLLWFFIPEAALFMGSGLDILRVILDRFTEAVAGSGGHFSAVEVTPILIVLIILMNIQLIPFKKRRHLLAAAPLISAGFAWALLISPAENRNELIIYQHLNGRTAVFIDESRAVIAGDMPDYDGARSIYMDISGRGIGRSVFVIDRPVYSVMPGYSFLARNLIVERCVLDSGFEMHFPVINFFNVLNSDGVEPELVRFTRLCAGGRSPDKGSPEYVLRAARCGIYEGDYTSGEFR